MKTKNQSFIFILFFIGIVSQVFSQNDTPQGWIQFRGEFGNGSSTQKIIEKDRIQNPSEILWKKEFGSGFSELVISDGVIYTMLCEKTDSISGFDYLLAMDESTGNEKWRVRVDSIYIENDGWGDGPRSTPAIDDQNIYSLSGKGKLSARLKENGKLLWEHDIVSDYGSTRPRWGYTSSPLVVDQMLVMEVGGNDGRAFMAFDKSNGEVVWANGSGHSTYNSPLLTSINKQKQLLFINGKNVHSYSIKGDSFWSYELPIDGPIAMPVLVDSTKLFFSQTMKGFAIIDIDGNNAAEVLTGKSMKNDFMTSVYHEGYLYGYSVATLRCISAETGEIKWSKRGFGKGSLILVDSKLIVMSDKGNVALVRATPDSYQELESLQAIDGSRSWTAPSFNDGKVYVRNHTEIACIKLN